MSDPQRERLGKKPERAQPWQPDHPARAGNYQDRDAGPQKTSPQPDQTQRDESRSVAAPEPMSRDDIQAAVSPEAAIPRDPMTGNKVPGEPSDPDEPTGSLGSVEKLHTRLIDAIRGFEEAIENAEPEVLGILTMLRQQHEDDARELADLLRRRHGEVSVDGSWMSTVQEAVMTARAWITGIDDGIIPAVVRGERALLGLYDDAIDDNVNADDIVRVLGRQRGGLVRSIETLESQAE